MCPGGPSGSQWARLVGPHSVGLLHAPVRHARRGSRSHRLPDGLDKPRARARSALGSPGTHRVAPVRGTCVRVQPCVLGGLHPVTLRASRAHDRSLQDPSIPCTRSSRLRSSTPQWHSPLTCPACAQPSMPRVLPARLGALASRPVLRPPAIPAPLLLPPCRHTRPLSAQTFTPRARAAHEEPGALSRVTVGAFCARSSGCAFACALSHGRAARSAPRRA